jgi:hypothetical protein
MKYEGKIADLIKDNEVQFVSVKKTLDGKDYVAEYDIPHEVKEREYTNWYRFSVPLSDIGTGTLMARDKAIYYMRWIRKAMEGDGLFFVRQSQNLFSRPADYLGFKHPDKLLKTNLVDIK